MGTVRATDSLPHLLTRLLWCQHARRHEGVLRGGEADLVQDVVRDTGQRHRAEDPQEGGHGA